MKPKNTICLWFNQDAHDAARFYPATFEEDRHRHHRGGAARLTD